jgi:hypothetical protein
VREQVWSIDGKTQVLRGKSVPLQTFPLQAINFQSTKTIIFSFQARNLFLELLLLRNLIFVAQGINGNF